MSLFGFEFNYNKNRIGRSKPIDEGVIIKIGIGKSNSDSMVVNCKTCGTYMDFEVGLSNILDGRWVCNICKSTVREKTAYNQLDRENMNFDKNLDLSDEDMPEGCEACGGPWPYCETSCKLYDN